MTYIWHTTKTRQDVLHTERVQINRKHYITLHCNTLHCNSRQKTATLCGMCLAQNVLAQKERTVFATHCNMQTTKHCNKYTLKYTVTHCNTLQHTTTTTRNTQTTKHCDKYTLKYTVTHCNTLQHPETHCKTPPNTATHYRMCSAQKECTTTVTRSSSWSCASTILR